MLPQKSTLLAYWSLLMLVGACLVNLKFTQKLLRIARRPKETDFTWNGPDFPETLASVRNPKDFPPALLTVEDSVHFDIADTEEWESAPPSGEGWFYLGPKRRQISVSMFHQLHCVYMFAEGIESRISPKPHARHCVDYMRQWILCTGDLTLEPLSDAFDWDNTSFSALDHQTRVMPFSGVGITHQCRDWSALYRAAEDGYADYVTWKAQRGEAVKAHKHLHSIG